MRGAMISLPRMAAFGAILLAFAAPAWAAGDGFLAEVDDLPLAPGLTELAGGTLFDSPTGRIVEANAQGNVLEVEARSFYDETLPELGWRVIGDDAYQRDKEILRIGYSDGLPMTVHFSIAPAPATTKDNKNDKADKDKDDKSDSDTKNQDEKGAQ